MHLIFGRSHHRLLIPFVLALVLVSIGNPGRASAGQATLDRIKLNAGESLAIRAIGFNRHETVNTWASGPNGAVFATESGVSDRHGDVRLAITIGRLWEPGWWAVTLRGSASGEEAVATFEVVGIPPDGILDVAPATVRPGQRVNFHGAGYGSGEFIKAWATLPDGSAVAVAKDPWSDSGDIYFSYDVPANALTGTWYMTAYGTQSQRLLVVPFYVVP